MTRSIRLEGLVIAAASLCATPLLAEHTPGLTRQEAMCQREVAGEDLPLFVKGKVRCLIRCERGERRGRRPASECEPPSYGGMIERCVTRKLNRTRKIILDESSCGRDCPECYSGGDCATDADDKLGLAGLLVDAVKANAYCDDTNGTCSSAGIPFPCCTGPGAGTCALTRREGVCQDAVANGFVEFFEEKSRCLKRCRDDEHDGDVPPGACAPPVLDLDTSICIALAEAETASKIDQKCDDPPECHFGTTGFGWVASFFEPLVDLEDLVVYCASASGAFLD